MCDKDLADAGQSACANSNLRCIYSLCVCVEVEAEVICLIISSAFLYFSLLIMLSCTRMHFAPKLSTMALHFSPLLFCSTIMTPH